LTIARADASATNAARSVRQSPSHSSSFPCDLTLDCRSVRLEFRSAGRIAVGQQEGVLHVKACSGTEPLPDNCIPLGGIEAFAIAPMSPGIRIPASARFGGRQLPRFAAQLLCWLFLPTIGE